LKVIEKNKNQLIEEIKQLKKARRNPEYFGPIYDKYYEPIFYFIFKRIGDKETTGDITSQVFLKALLNLDKFKFRGYPFSSWLYRIAINEVNMYFRKSKKEVVVEITERDVVDVMKEIEIVPEKTKMEYVMEAMSELKIEQSQLLEMRFFEKCSFKEIGEIYGVTEANAKMKVYRILNKLKKMIEKRGGLL